VYERQVQLWQVENLDFSETCIKPVCVVRSCEQSTQKRVQGGNKISSPQESQWTQGYGLEHCYHHHASMLAQMQSKLVCAGKQTAKTLAEELNLALEQDSAWEPWFCSD
jgi:hypothetical protein